MPRPACAAPRAAASATYGCSLRYLRRQPALPTAAASVTVRLQPALPTDAGMLLCAEMLIASLVHPFVFPPEDYAPDLLGPAFARRPSSHHGPSMHSALLEALIPKDVAEHVRQASAGKGHSPQHCNLM